MYRFCSSYVGRPQAAQPTRTMASRPDSDGYSPLGLPAARTPPCHEHTTVLVFRVPRQSECNRGGAELAVVVCSGQKTTTHRAATMAINPVLVLANPLPAVASNALSVERHRTAMICSSAHHHTVCLAFIMLPCNSCKISSCPHP